MLDISYLICCPWAFSSRCLDQIPLGTSHERKREFPNKLEVSLPSKLNGKLWAFFCAFPPTKCLEALQSNWSPGSCHVIFQSHLVSSKPHKCPIQVADRLVAQLSTWDFNLLHLASSPEPTGCQCVRWQSSCPRSKGRPLAVGFRTICCVEVERKISES